MHDDEDNVLAAYDLSAWEAPPPSAGLADAVIARAREPAAAAAIDVAMERDRLRRWIWIGVAGAAGAMAATAILLGIFQIHRGSDDEREQVTTNVPSPVPAELRPAGGPEEARIRELREQIEKLNAERDELRRQLDLLDPRTCDEVSCVLNNYEGTCCAKFKTAKTVGGVKPTPARAGNPCDEIPCVLSNYTGACCAKWKPPAVLERPPPGEPVEQAACDEVSCVLSNNESACCAKFKRTAKPPPNTPALDRPIIDAAMKPVSDKVRRCPPGTFVGLVKANLVVAAAGKVTSVRLDADHDIPSGLTTCLRGVLQAARFPETTEGGSFAYPFVFGAADATPACDADALRQKGDDHLATGMDAAALVDFEASLQCRADALVLKKAFLAACRSKNASRANYYYPKLPASQRGPLAQMCARVGIQLTEPGEE